MEFGAFLQFECLPGQTHTEAFAKGFELIDDAERWGLDAVWLAEMHFSPDRSVLSAPMTISSAIAARTKRVKIGTAVQVLPLGNPLRMAEEAATVDQISQGRLIFGVGRSGFPRAYETYGVPYAESRERFREALTIIKKAWTEEKFGYEGRWHSFHNVTLSPKPYQRPHPDIRVAAATIDTYPALGKGGYAMFGNVRVGTISDLRPHLEVYRAAWREAGHPGEGRVYLRIPVYIAPTREAALAEPEESMMHYFRGFAERLGASATSEGTRAIEQRAERAQWMEGATYADILREKVIVGTPAMVTERLQEIREELGINGILAELNCGGRIPRERIVRTLRLLCEEVMPHFQ